MFNGKNPLSLWSFSIAMLVHQRVNYGILSPKKSGNGNDPTVAVAVAMVIC